jgi:hypothetical protein
MGRDASFYCRTCRTEYYLGYGSYSSWLDRCKTLHEYDEAAQQTGNGDLLKNANLRKCLAEHEGHQYETHSGDWTYQRDGVLYGEFGVMGAGVPLIPDYAEWQFVDLDPDDIPVDSKKPIEG